MKNINIQGELLYLLVYSKFSIYFLTDNVTIFAQHVCYTICNSIKALILAIFLAICHL